MIMASITMAKLAITSLIVGSATSFSPSSFLSERVSGRCFSSPTSLHGYLDDLTAELASTDGSPESVDEDSRDATKMDKSQIQNAGPGTFADFVDFNEFDGGDGQMGVAGDGNAGLEKMDAVPQIAKSKMMSAKNAWGTSTGYADKLLEKDPKMDTARAQQLENWANQQEVRAKNQQLKEMAENFDAHTVRPPPAERRVCIGKRSECRGKWNAKFIVVRSQVLGGGELEGSRQVRSGEDRGLRLGRSVRAGGRRGRHRGRDRVEDGDQSGGDAHSSGEFSLPRFVYGLRRCKFFSHCLVHLLILHAFCRRQLRNPYMGFADFRAAFTSNTPMDWTVEPNEGALKQREDTEFTLKFKPQGPGLIEGTLVIETEDFKKTWQVQGST